MADSASIPVAAAQSPTFSRFDLPGLNLPLNFTPHEARQEFIWQDDGGHVTKQVPAQGEGKNLFRTALNSEDVEGGYVSQRLTPLRELTMLHIMDALTDKPGWEEKVFNEEIANKWKVEALSTEGRDVTQSMADWIIEELRYKVEGFKETGAVIVYAGDVVKSDLAVPTMVNTALKEAVKVLENVPEVYKDYHPGSDGKVLDLVHPSLFPLVYGKTRVLPDSLIELDNCLENCGNGIIVPIRPDDETALARRQQPWGWHFHQPPAPPYSKQFQWLPSEVEFTEDGKAKIVSYINNLHPVRYKGLYSLIEGIIDHSIPQWNITLTPLNEKARYSMPKFKRIPYDQVIYDPDPEEMEEDEKPQQEEDEDEDEYYERLEVWAEDIRKIILPEPGPFAPPTVDDYRKKDLAPGTTDKLKPERHVDLKRDYLKRGLQVIVKLANIELTPENPEYEGGTWHVEGQLNEHICATALYYYDSENITHSRLAFRHQCSRDDASEISYPQSQHDFMQAVFGLDPEGPAVQEIGSVACVEGRLLTFPNILQHQVQPFKLADPTKPGHRKILALFLVDPGIRIISTANVPPQQRDWWSERVIRHFAKEGTMLAKLSAELKEKVFEGVDFPIGMEDAKEIRLRLMEERKHYVVDQKRAFEQQTFSLCEH